MDPLESASIECPYCGESLEVSIDTSSGSHEYIEDCQVCCKPIVFRVRVGPDGEARIEVRSEDD